MGKERFIKKLTIHGGIRPVLKAIGENDLGKFKALKKGLSKKNIFIVKIEIKDNFYLDVDEFYILIEGNLLYGGILKKDENVTDIIMGKVLDYMECG